MWAALGFSLALHCLLGLWLMASWPVKKGAGEGQAAEHVGLTVTLVELRQPERAAVDGKAAMAAMSAASSGASGELAGSMLRDSEVAASEASAKFAESLERRVQADPEDGIKEAVENPEAEGRGKASEASSKGPRGNGKPGEGFASEEVRKNKPLSGDEGGQGAMLDKSMTPRQGHESDADGLVSRRLPPTPVNLALPENHSSLAAYAGMAKISAKVKVDSRGKPVWSKAVQTEGKEPVPEAFMKLIEQIMFATKYKPGFSGYYVAAGEYEIEVNIDASGVVTFVTKDPVPLEVGKDLVPDAKMLPKAEVDAKRRASQKE